MGKARQPIELVKAKGKKHLTKKEIELREKSELKVDLKDVSIPDYLPNKLKEEFESVASKLLKIGIITELDEDCLARYLLSKQSYLLYTSMLNKAITKNNLNEMEKLTTMQKVNCQVLIVLLINLYMQMLLILVQVDTHYQEAIVLKKLLH